VKRPQFKREPIPRRPAPPTVWADPAAPLRAVSTVRAPGAARQRYEELLLPTRVAWVKAQPCEFPRTEAHQFDPGHAGGDAHHEPTTGSNGRRIDDLTAACCRRAHDLCEASPTNGGWTVEQKQAAAHRTSTRFRRLAPRATQLQDAREQVEALE
jgi:hypothetical protein